MNTRKDTFKKPAEAAILLSLQKNWHSCSLKVMASVSRNN